MDDNNELKRLFKQLKRQYHKAKKVYEDLREIGSFGLEIKGNQNELKISCRIPDEEKTVQFVVLMRPLLDVSSPIYYKKIWLLIKNNFPEIVTSKVKTEFEIEIAQIDNGYFPINYNGSALTNEHMYQVISNGDYFDQLEKDKKFLENLKSSPLGKETSELFLFGFYSYNEGSLLLLSSLFSLIQRIEQTFDKLVNVYEDMQCIFCLTKTGPFTSEEHIIPENLGNTDLILPIGLVCDKCNNSVLSPLDQSLMEYLPIALLRVNFVQHGKDGKLTKANFANAEVRRTKPNHILFKNKIGQQSITEIQKLEDGFTKISFKINGKNNIKLVSRALYKIALEIVALDMGFGYASSSQFDAARNFVVKKGVGFSNNLLIMKNCQPQPGCKIEFNPNLGFIFSIILFGIEFILNLEEIPTLELKDEPFKSQFEVIPLA